MQHSEEFIKLCDDAKRNIKEVTSDEANELISTNSIDYLIDVRDQDEYLAGHIPSAIHLSKGWIEAKIHHHAKKDDKILLYCGGGNRSILAADNLHRMGYQNVYSMIGGYKDWAK